MGRSTRAGNGVFTVVLSLVALFFALSPAKGPRRALLRAATPRAAAALIEAEFDHATAAAGQGPYSHAIPAKYGLNASIAAPKTLAAAPKTRKNGPAERGPEIARARRAARR